MNMLKENRSYIYAHYALHDKDMVIPIIDFLISSNFNVKNSNFSNMHKEDAAYKKEILDNCTYNNNCNSCKWYIKLFCTKASV